MELGFLFLGVKWSGCEADQSPQSSAKIKHDWSNTSTPPEVVLCSDERVAKSFHLINQSLNRLGLFI
jgi:hypothetical protein